MGQCFNWVNVDKHEWLDGAFWGNAPTLHGRTIAPCEENQALLTLLTTRWRGDVVVFFGDYADFSGIDHPGCRYIQAALDAAHLDPADFMYESREAVGNFKIAKDSPNNRRNDPDNESLDYYEGPFDLDLMGFRYVVNPARGEYIDYQKLPVVALSDGLIQRYDPLPLLLSSAIWALGDPKEDIEARWLGDIVYPSNKAPQDSFTSIAEQYVDYLTDGPVLWSVSDDEVMEAVSAGGIDISVGSCDDAMRALGKVFGQTENRALCIL